MQSQATTPPPAAALEAAIRHKVKPPKLYRIGDVVEYSGMSRQTIHNYTLMGLLKESRRTESGHRLYDESVFDRLDAIAAMRSQSKSLEAIRQYLESQGRRAQAED
ncbi:MAG: MerR family transcriptional regulator [Phycisphaerae bacterium]